MEHPQFAVQVKGGKVVTTTTFRSGMDDAIEAFVRSGKPPLLAITDRSGTTLRRYVAMPEEVFADLYLRCYICNDVPVLHPRRFDELRLGDHVWVRDARHSLETAAAYSKWKQAAQRRLDNEEAAELD